VTNSLKNTLLWTATQWRPNKYYDQVYEWPQTFAFTHTTNISILFSTT